jgi:hypothetical protein
MVGGLDARETVSPFPCALDSEATFDFAKVSVYDTSLGQSSTCNVALNLQTPQVTPTMQQTAQQLVKPAAQTIVTQNTQQTQNQQNTLQQQQLPNQTQQEQQVQVVCRLRDIGDICRRDRHCCSGMCEGFGWNQKYSACRRVLSNQRP